MKKYKKFIYLFFFLFITNCTLSKFFKVKHEYDNVIYIENLKLIPGLDIHQAYLVLGKNSKGFLEAVAFPKKETQYKDQGQVDYWYIRFHPEWYNKHIAHDVLHYLPKDDQFCQELVNRAKLIHQENFHYFMHFLDYPILKEGVIAGKIKLVGLMEKVDFYKE